MIPRLTVFLGSSVVEQVTVNHLVGGSNPPRGANKRSARITLAERFFLMVPAAEDGFPRGH
jgi:hypothetical protein